jgi:hypothetical protein
MWVFVPAMLGPGRAIAQDEAPAAPAAPAVPVPPAVSPPAPPAPPGVPAQERSEPCEIGDHAGVSPDDAAVASQLVCAEIARLGASPSARFRVSVGKLGSAIILSVTERHADAARPQTDDLRVMRLENLQAIPDAAPRIARAIVLDLPIEEPPQVVPPPREEPPREDAPAAPKRGGGTTHFAMGLVGLLTPPDRVLYVVPGIDFDVHHETEDGAWEMGGDLRGGYQSESPGAGAGFLALSAGAKYFTSRAEASPYLGGGLVLEALGLSIPSLNFEGVQGGPGAYLDAGVELFRKNHAHLAFGARLDLPFFTIGNNNYGSSSVAPAKFYYAPLTLEGRITF